MDNEKEKYIKSEWYRFKRYCLNNEEMGFNNLSDYRSFCEDNGYENGGHSHPYKLLYINNKYIPIDAEIYEAIKYLNSNGLPTVSCCSGHFDKDGDDFGYIMFDTTNVNNVKMSSFISLVVLALSKIMFVGTTIEDNITMVHFTIPFGGTVEECYAKLNEAFISAAKHSFGK